MSDAIYFFVPSFYPFAFRWRHRPAPSIIPIGTRPQVSFASNEFGQSGRKMFGVICKRIELLTLSNRGLFPATWIPTNVNYSNHVPDRASATKIARLDARVLWADSYDFPIPLQFWDFTENILSGIFFFVSRSNDSEIRKFRFSSGKTLNNFSSNSRYVIDISVGTEGNNKDFTWLPDRITRMIYKMKVRWMTTHSTWNWNTHYLY